MTECRIPEAVSRIMTEKRLSGNLRRIPSGADGGGGALDLVSNDYLGLAARASRGEFDAVREQVARTASFTSSASRLLSTRQREYARLEDLLGSLYRRPALLFNSGYHANVGLVSALNVGKTLFVVDRLVHASVYDGLRVGDCAFERFRHNDMEHLERILERRQDEYDTLVVVVESIYSMDGDLAPLRALVILRERFPKMLLYVDEAHGVGVRGLRGLGLCEETATTDSIDIIVGTFGKALASSGAFAVCSDELRRYFLNSSRSFIFSTALPPVCVAWSREMLRLSLDMTAERAHLAALSQWFSSRLSALTGHDTGSRSQIVPLLIGDPRQAVELSALLREAGFEALAIRRPTVPPKGERIRFSLSAGLSRNQLLPLIDLLKETPLLSPQ